MKLLIFSLLLCFAWAQEDPPTKDHVLESEQEEYPPGQDNVNSTEVVEGAGEAFGDGVAKSPRSWQYFNGRSFTFISSSVSWGHAQQVCLSLGANLAAIHNYREEQFVKQLARGQAAWIGLSDSQIEGFWFWINSDRLVYTNWCPGEPNNYMDQHCVQINYSGNRCWDDLWCNHGRPFVCEKK